MLTTTHAKATQTPEGKRSLKTLTCRPPHSGVGAVRMDETMNKALPSKAGRDWVVEDVQPFPNLPHKNPLFNPIQVLTPIRFFMATAHGCFARAKR